MKILIVDDHQSVRRNLRSLLAPVAADLDEAVDGLDAVEKARTWRPELILLDVSMPRMNGLDAARIIRREVPSAKLILVSHSDPNVAARQMQEVSASGWVSKSHLGDQLIATVQRVLAAQSSARPSPAPPKTSQPSWLRAGGELGQLIRDYDWSQTPLGPLESWPNSIRTAVNLMLNSSHPMWIGWGPEATFLYNDAYISVLSLAKHPAALGQPASVVWSEIWAEIGPLVRKVFENGEATFVNDVRLFMSRGGYLEETFYSFSYSPIFNESGKVTGLFCPSAETSAGVIGARRIRTLSELSSRALLEKSVSAACASAFATLAKNPDDIPFALLYLLDGTHKFALLEQQHGINSGFEQISPPQVPLDDSSPHCAFWRLREAVESRVPQVVSFADLDLEPVAIGPANQPVMQAMILPVIDRGNDRPIGILIAGVSPARRLDSEYHSFFDLIANQISAAIQSAEAATAERNRIEALAEIDRAKTAFFSNVSHEFRTPLTLMLGPVEDLLSRSHTDLTPAAKNQLELVNRNGSRLLRLVNTLLDFSRIEAGRTQAVYQSTDLAALTNELASVFRSATEKAGIALDLDCPPLPELVYIDREMWEKIVLNLISNAFKFTFEGGIYVSLRPAGNSVELSVRDTGVGIPTKELPHLFDRFHRVQDTRSRTQEGSGIGLALVQELVKLHGGNIRFDSTLGQGTTFTVSVPTGSAHLPADRISASRAYSSSSTGAGSFVEEALGWLPGAEPDPASEIPDDRRDDRHAISALPVSTNGPRPRVLLADDNADMRQYLARLLSENYEVESFSDGRSALDAALANPPDLVLSDVMMPQLDGFGLLRELRENASTNTVPLILLSARAGESARIEGLERGADDYLIKPFSARELLARVQTHLELSRVRRRGEILLRENKDRFELVAQAVQVGFWFSDLPIANQRWDARVREHFWLPPDTPVSDGIFKERIHPDDRQRASEAINASITTGSPYRIEYRTVSPNDPTQIKWIRATGQVFFDEHGVPNRFDGITVDITERKHAEERERIISEQAQSANAKFRAAFHQGSHYAGVLTLDGVMIDINRLALNACGYTEDQVLGIPFWETPWWRNSNESKEKIRQAVALAARGENYREILPYYWADGTERLVDFWMDPITDDNGRVIFVHPNGIDITDLKNAEEKYRNLSGTLEQQVKSRTELLELRNAEILQQSRQLRELSQRLMQMQDEERRHIARELHDSAGQNLTALGMNLARIVSFARQVNPILAREAEDSAKLVRELSQEIRTTSYLLHPPLLDESGLTEAVSWYARGLHERGRLDVTVDIPEDFGRLPRQTELAIFRVVQECLTNVHRHSGSKRATIRLRNEAGNVVLEVHDEGQGIPAEKLAQLQSQGGGVGFRGMRERVLQLNGQIQIDSRPAGNPAHGTAIRITLPLTTPASS